MTDKRKPSYSLAALQEADRNGSMRYAQSALAGAAQMLLAPSDISRVIQGLEHGDFYKSTTSFADHRVWMDVYHARYETHDIYIKFTSAGMAEIGYVLTSFKARD